VRKKPSRATSSDLGLARYRSVDFMNQPVTDSFSCFGYTLKHKMRGKRSKQYRKLMQYVRICLLTTVLLLMVDQDNFHSHSGFVLHIKYLVSLVSLLDHFFQLIIALQLTPR